MPPRLFLSHSLKKQHLAALILSTSAWFVLDVPIAQPFKLGTSVVLAQTVEDRKAEADRLLQEGIQNIIYSLQRKIPTTLQKS